MSIDSGIDRVSIPAVQRTHQDRPLYQVTAIPIMSHLYKKAVFFLEKDCFFVGYLSSFSTICRTLRLYRDVIIWRASQCLPEKKIKQNQTQAVCNLIAVKAQVLTRLGFYRLLMKGKSDVDKFEMIFSRRPFFQKIVDLFCSFFGRK